MVNAMKKIAKTLKADKGYFYAWQANIAVTFKDEYFRDKKKYKNKEDIHRIANNAAKQFLDLLCK